MSFFLVNIRTAAPSTGSVAVKSQEMIKVTFKPRLVYLNSHGSSENAKEVIISLFSSTIGERCKSRIYWNFSRKSLVIRLITKKH